MTMRVEHLVTDDRKPYLHGSSVQESGPTISRWRWRPGMKPRFALAIGVLFSVVGPLFVVIGLVSAGLILQVKQMVQDEVTGILKDVNGMTSEVHRTLPSLLSNVDGTLRNVKHISDDAAGTAHTVTATVNRVANVIGSVATRMESPLIKSVGLIAGIAAGLRTLTGGRDREDSDEKKKKKRRRFLGIF